MAGLAPLVGEMLGVERAPIEVDATTACATASASATRSTSRSRTSCRSASRRASRCGSTACSIRSASDLTMAEATRSRINAFGIEYEGKTGLSTSEFSWAA